VAPSEVLQRMNTVTEKVAEFVREASGRQQRLMALSWQFAWIGKIHPFLDGNGLMYSGRFSLRWPWNLDTN
jgi:Fic family protein